MEQNETKQLVETFANEYQFQPHTILTIARKPKLTVSDDETGMELNDGYDFTMDAALPEVADAIAKFAKELPNNGFGETSDTYFMHLVNEYFLKLKEE